LIIPMVTGEDEDDAAPALPPLNSAPIELLIELELELELEAGALEPVAATPQPVTSSVSVAVAPSADLSRYLFMFTS
jgi:hypothetical protein